jgi:phosphoribosylformylglycinamidine synthase
MKKHTNELLDRSFSFTPNKKERKMATIVVDVMLKPEILDPQGKAVAAALPRLGFTFAADVRQGKRFEITVDGEPTAAQLAEVEIAAEKLLSNPVIENFTVRVEK